MGKWQPKKQGFEKYIWLERQERLAGYHPFKVLCSNEGMTFTTPLQPTEPDLSFSETDQEAEAQLPEPPYSRDEAILIAFQTWALRLILTSLAEPSHILNAMRRLEAMKDFSLRAEKQARTLAIAEARIELQRRTLALREAQLKESREKREFAMATAKAKAEAKAAKAAAAEAKAAERLATKTKPTPQPTPAPVAVQNITVQPIPSAPIDLQETASPSQTGNLQTILSSEYGNALGQEETHLKRSLQ
jgi:hypothetical protein